MLRYLFLALILAATSARAELHFVYEPLPGISARLQSHEIAVLAATNASPQLWGARACNGVSGRYAYAGHHAGNVVPVGFSTGYLFKRRADGGYDDVTPMPVYNAAGQVFEQMAAGSAPICADLNNDGDPDFINRDDECSACETLLSDGSGGWTFSPAYTFIAGSGLEIVDINGDGLPDVREYSRTRLNTGTGFADPVPRPLGERLGCTDVTNVTGCIVPQEVIDRSTASLGDAERFQRLAVYEVGGDVFATYSGAYGAGAETWHVIVRDGVIIERWEGGTISIPFTVDGVPALLWRGLDVPERGIYRRSPADGRYYRDTAEKPRPNGGPASGLNYATLRNHWNAGGYVFQFTIGDWDGDGDDDMLIDGMISNTYWIMENTGSSAGRATNDPLQGLGVFTLHKFSRSVKGEGLHVADIDGDGDMDIVAAGQGPATGGDNYYGAWINQASAPTDPLPDPDPVPDPGPVDPFIAVNAALDAALGAVFDAQTCAVQMQSECTQEAIDAAQAALMTAEQSL